MLLAALLKLVIFLASLTFCSETFLERASQLWRSMRKTTSCKKRSESPGCSSLLIFLWPIRSREFERFWNWFVKRECPGALPFLVVNFHHEHYVVPTSCPWVSDDGLEEVWSQAQAIPGADPENCGHKNSFRERKQSIVARRRITGYDIGGRKQNVLAMQSIAGWWGSGFLEPFFFHAISLL